ncbi:MAG: cupin domain-containing protein [bacterium]|nr:cupin domain-containing protein [bacterium]
MNNEVFEAFNKGSFAIPGKVIAFDQINWSKHPTFEGVELKHIVTAAQTDGQFSYHLVRIAPGCAIKNHIHETQLETHEVIAGSGVCINDGTKLAYAPGVVSLMPAKVPHEVAAGEDGLYLFAKFMPALC